MKQKFFLTLFLFFTFPLFSLENSIVSQIEALESGKALTPEKYGAHQYQEILSAIAKKKERVRVVSYNVLFNLYDHNLKEPYKWPQRAPRVIKMIEEMQPDLLGIQELYPEQRDDLLKALKEKYAFFSKPAGDGELSGIFYNKHRFKVLDSRVLFLSDKGPNHPASETLTLLHLQDNITEQPLAIFNTHLSFSKVEKRIAQAKKIHQFISLFHKTHPDVALILTGDLNTFPNCPDLTALPFYDGDYTQNLIKKDLFHDAKDRAILGHIGPLSSFTNKDEDPAPFRGTGTPGIFLDHIYVSADVTVLLHAVNPATEDSLWPSDHMPLIADIALPEKKRGEKEKRTEQDSNL